MGIPLSGVLGKAEIMDAPVAGGVGGTYVGNPVAIAAALAVLDTIEDEGLVERSADDRRGPCARGCLPGRNAGRRSATCAASARCSRSSWSTSSVSPTADAASRVIDEALARGVLLLRAGVGGNCIRVLVPLVVGDDELEEALEAWEQALSAAL